MNQINTTCNQSIDYIIYLLLAHPIFMRILYGSQVVTIGYLLPIYIYIYIYIYSLIKKWRVLSIMLLFSFTPFSLFTINIWQLQYKHHKVFFVFRNDQKSDHVSVWTSTRKNEDKCLRGGDCHVIFG
jgi:hypothetical protein